MLGIKKLSFDCKCSSIYSFTVTFFNEEDERVFLHKIKKLFCKYVVSSLIHDLDVDIELYKRYFQPNTYSIFEENPTQPYITCSTLDSKAIDLVIENWGYYTLDAYLYWSKEGIEFHNNGLDKEDCYFMNYSDLTIRQVLDLSLEIRVNDKAISVLWDMFKGEK
jgi:hypothetical protein